MCVWVGGSGPNGLKSHFGFVEKTSVASLFSNSATKIGLQRKTCQFNIYTYFIILLDIK